MFQLLIGQLANLPVCYCRPGTATGMSSYHVFLAITSICLDNPEGLSATFVACGVQETFSDLSLYVLRQLVSEHIELGVPLIAVLTYSHGIGTARYYFG